MFDGTPGGDFLPIFAQVRTVVPHLYSRFHPNPFRFGEVIIEKPFSDSHVSVSLFVCLLLYLRNQKPHGETSPKFLVHVTHGHGWVIMWWQCDMVYFSFVTDVIHAHNHP